MCSVPRRAERAEAGRRILCGRTPRFRRRGDRGGPSPVRLQRRCATDPEADARIHGVDPERIAYLGISYGGAMGALFAGIERRIKAAVLVVGDGGLVSHFTGPEDASFMAGLPCATRVSWFQAMAPIEPIRFVAHAAPTPLLLQSGRSDNLVPVADAQALQAAASQPKTVLWYDAGHGLNPQAASDRMDWLHREIGLDPRQ